MTSLMSHASQPVREAWPLERLILERSICLGMALQPNTSRAYSSHLNSYLSFCALHGLSVEPTPDTLSFFITFMSHHIQPRSVESYLSGIVSQLEPHFPSVRASRQTQLVRRTLQGARRLYSHPIHRKRALLRDDLSFAFHALPHPLAFDDLLWLTQLFCGFFGLLRLGELVCPDLVDLRDSSSYSLRNSVHFSPTEFSFVLQHQKTDSRYEGDRVTISRSVIHPDPLALFHAYLTGRDSCFPLHPHLWVRSDGSHPSRSWFVRRLRTLFPSTDVSGHSMRAGGATSLAAAGVPPERIQALGRWRSTAWERYVRKSPALLQTLLFHGRAPHDPPFANA